LMHWTNEIDEKSSARRGIGAIDRRRMLSVKLPALRRLALVYSNLVVTTAHSA